MRNQLPLPEPFHKTVDLDGVVGKRKDKISYIGTFTEQPNGLYRGLANVGGMLCLVEVNLHA